MAKRPGGILQERAIGSYAWEVVGVDCTAKNAADVICHEHCVQTVWSGDRQFAWESATQFGRHCSHWVEITSWTYRQVMEWLGY